MKGKTFEKYLVSIGLKIMSAIFIGLYFVKLIDVKCMKYHPFHIAGNWSS